MSDEHTLEDFVANVKAFAEMYQSAINRIVATIRACFEPYQETFERVAQMIRSIDASLARIRMELAQAVLAAAENDSADNISYDAICEINALLVRLGRLDIQIAVSNAIGDTISAERIEGSSKRLHEVIKILESAGINLDDLANFDESSELTSAEMSSCDKAEARMFNILQLLAAIIGIITAVAIPSATMPNAAAAATPTPSISAISAPHIVYIKQELNIFIQILEEACRCDALSQADDRPQGNNCLEIE